MKKALKKGFGFGLTSGVITTLGLMIGLDAGTHSTPIVLGGILTIAIADAFSDALGVHISEEYQAKKSPGDVWAATFFTFIFKLIFAMTFVVPVLLLELSTAIWVSLAWGFGIISILSFQIAREQKESAWKVVGEHFIICLIVVIATHYVGDTIAKYFVS